MFKRLLAGLLFLAAASLPAFSQATVGLCTWSLVNNILTCTQVSATNPLPVTIGAGSAVIGTVNQGAPGASPWPVTFPTGTTTQTKSTVSVTNTYVQALASNASRKGCAVQYIAVAGTKGYVFFGSAPGDTTTSFQLTNGQSINCNALGVVLTDAVQVTGTGTDIFIVSNQ